MNSSIRVGLVAAVFSGCGFVPTSPEPQLDAGLAMDAGVERDAGVDPDAGTELDAGLPQPLSLVAFNDTYGADNFGGCNKTSAITGFEPMTVGKKYPLFIYTVGTLDNWGYSGSLVYTPSKPNEVVLEILREAASRGLVAASIEYDNFFLVDCGGLRAKTHCIFDPMDQATAVSKLCARPNVDCELGIITAGHSQGSQLAAYAKNWNSRVRATWGLGVTSDAVIGFGSGDQPGLSNATGNNDDRCLRADRTALTEDRMRLVNGLNEMCFSTSVPGFNPLEMNPAASCGPASSQGELERISGMHCSTDSMNCTTDAGSGWLIIPNSAVEGGSAHHTWFGIEVDAGVSRPEVHFAAPSTEPWSISTNVEWLKQFTGAPDTQPLRIDCGANTALDGTFSKDDFHVGGGGATSNEPIDVSAPNAAPESVYQSHRYEWLGGDFAYVLRGLPPNVGRTLRLHFAETFWTAGGSREFNVEVQGARVETDLDVFALTGGKNRALVREYPVLTDAQGRVRIDFKTGSANLPMVSGLELLP
ncbi:MAG: malectin domain-containing carbohydrate-binding protein [Archangium sp.]